MMDAELKQRWIDALDGLYSDRKSEGQLHSDDGCMCAFGVLLDIENAWTGGKPDIDLIDNDYELLSNYVPSAGKQAEIWAINDGAETFAPVIEYIRENL